MAFNNILPRTTNTTGASCTGVDGASDRTYTLSDSGVMSTGFNITVNGTSLHEGTGKDFTASGSIITFLNALWDTSVIRINYFIATDVSAPVSTDLKYATPQELGEILGIIKDIPSWDVEGSPTKEEVGTGDASTTTFYLDQKSVVSDSYTFYHGADANNLTTLTDETHYDLDNDTGTLVLTSSGVTEVSTDKIYAEYQYFDNGMKDSYIISILKRAEKEVDNLTNSIFTDGTATNPTYPYETEIQSSEGLFMDRIITKKKPLKDIESSLDGDITSSQDTIDLTAGEGSDFPTAGYIIIGSEVITYTGITTDQLTGCTRAALGTTAAAHSGGDAVHSTILFRSDTTEGTAVSWDVQPWDTSMNATDEGLLYVFEDADPDPITRRGIANRIKIMYYYGYDTIPNDIERLTLLLAKRMLVQDNIGKAMIAGRDGEMTSSDSEEIESIISSYIVISMGNT